MKAIFKNPSQIITVNSGGLNYKRGREMSVLNPLIEHSIIVENGIIKDFVPNSAISKTSAEMTFDMKGTIMLPGLIECHTHSAYAGSRSDEFLNRLKGATYEEIAKAGGGITSTMQSVRNSSFEELVKLLKPRIAHFISQGVTSLEIKSGYGLSYYDEIKLLQVINHFKSASRIEIIPTFLGAHTYPPEYKNDHKGYLNLIINELLPYLIKNKLTEHVDAFCEETAFSSEEVDKIFARAKKLGYKLRLHTDQFKDVGGLDVAIKHKVLSVDHLEVISDENLSKLAKSEIVSVLLPGVSLFLDHNYAPARELIDKNGIVALSTDFNPGSSHIPNLQLIMQIASLKMKMSCEEIISAVTINAARALGISEMSGSIEIGKQADFVAFKCENISEIIYNIGINLNKYTIKKGEVIFNNPEIQ